MTTLRKILLAGTVFSLAVALAWGSEKILPSRFSIISPNYNRNQQRPLSSDSAIFQANPRMLSASPTTSKNKAEEHIGEALKNVFSTKSNDKYQYRYLPDSCLANPMSETCQTGFDRLVNEKCGGELNSPQCSQIKEEVFDYLGKLFCPNKNSNNSAMCQCVKSKDLESQQCEEAYSQILAKQFEDSCKKNPNKATCKCLSADEPSKCFGSQLGVEIAKKIMCPIDLGFRSALGKGIFSGPIDCSTYKPSDKLHSNFKNLGAGNVSPNCLADPENAGCLGEFQNNCVDKPGDPACQKLHRYFCQSDPNLYGCHELCESDPQTENCLIFLKEYCKTSFDSLCQEIVCTYAPNICNFCTNYPNACSQLLQNYLPSTKVQSDHSD